MKCRSGARAGRKLSRPWRNMRRLFTALAIVAIGDIGCGGRREAAREVYKPLAEAEATYGRLIGAGNRPTAYQHGTGERVGFFLDAQGTIWGLPIRVSSSGAISACAPLSLQASGVTDTFPQGATIIGSTNEPTGWRGGTGDLELLLRNGSQTTHHKRVRGADLGTAACSTPQSVKPLEALHYYRLVPKEGDE
jgi:hypothetical protein